MSRSDAGCFALVGVVLLDRSVNAIWGGKIANLCVAITLILFALVLCVVKERET